ncbi:MAG: polysaccharide deacetylase family protein [bacterium]|nr:polysaccharide deacetylase family protein [bacterium]
MSIGKKQLNSAYIVVCYHYIRPVINDPFPRILGVRQDIFMEHVRILKKAFRVMALAEVIDGAPGNVSRRTKEPGLLFSFDDGLADHYAAAKILAEHGISAIFFIPTCILIEKEPINPVIIHHCLSRYGIARFLKMYRQALEECGLSFNVFPIFFRPGADDPIAVIQAIKKIFKYQMQHGDARRVLRFIYENSLKRDVKDVFKMLHLTHDQVAEMVEMGHTIGAHTHSHLSVASAHLSEENFEKEVLAPKQYLEREFGTQVVSFSYPFGESQDFTGAVDRLRQSGTYRLAFTVENKLNIIDTSPLMLGRHTVHSADSAEKILSDLQELYEEQA